jgi:hypothetical protein
MKRAETCRDTVRVSGRKGLLYSCLLAIAEWTQ